MPDSISYVLRLMSDLVTSSALHNLYSVFHHKKLSFSIRKLMFLFVQCSKNPRV